MNKDDFKVNTVSGLNEFSPLKSSAKRISGYILSAIVVSLLLLFAISINGNWEETTPYWIGILQFIAGFGIFIEVGSYFTRKKFGFTYWGSFDDNIERLIAEGKVIDDRVGVESNVSNSPVEKDLAYWFDMFEKGAITEVEYEVKKEEMLK